MLSLIVRMTFVDVDLRRKINCYGNYFFVTVYKLFCAPESVLGVTRKVSFSLGMLLNHIP